MAPHVLVPLEGAAVSTVDDLASRAAVRESLAPAKRGRQSMCSPHGAGIAALALIRAHAPQLLEQRSIGTVTAAVIIGRTAGAQQYRSEACFARHAGTAPIRANSGKTIRFHLHRGGDRQLNGV